MVFSEDTVARDRRAAFQMVDAAADTPDQVGSAALRDIVPLELALGCQRTLILVDPNGQTYISQLGISAVPTWLSHTWMTFKVGIAKERMMRLLDNGVFAGSFRSDRALMMETGAQILVRSETSGRSYRQLGKV